MWPFPLKPVLAAAAVWSCLGAAVWAQSGAEAASYRLSFPGRLDPRRHGPAGFPAAPTSHP